MSTTAAGFLGADTDALDRLAARMNHAATDLFAITGKLRTQTANTQWYGQDADEFRQRLGQAFQFMTTTASALQQVSAKVSAQSAQQRQVSAPNGGPGVVGPARPPVRVGRDGFPAAGSTPASVNQWWDSLTRAQQSALMKSDPARIGAMNGLPTAVRGIANEIVLQDQIAVVAGQQARIERLSWVAGPMGRAALAGRAQDLAEKMAGLQAVRDHLDRHPDSHLLQVDAAGNGRVVLALGDPDTADHVSVFVPGMTSNLAGAGGLINQAQVLRDSAIDADPTAVTASVLWLGYDAPQGVISAFSESRAAAAGANLDSSLDGVQASHLGGQADVTVVGHSYGSLVTGLADRDHQLAANRIFFIGSPGVGVNHASDLPIGAANVYSSTAGNDVIRYTPSLGELGKIGLGLGFPQLLPIIGAELADSNDPDLRFGTSPSSPGFGATVFQTESGTRSPVEAHSSYFVDGTNAEEWLGRVIVGRRP